MKFPQTTDDELVRALAPPVKKVHVVIDTDTYNEVDDQFALAYALRSPERMRVEAVYAAPFHNRRSTGPADGMEKSYGEILRILDLLKVPSDGLVYRGATGYLVDAEMPQESDAARDLAERAMARDGEPLYVVALGAITNVASAILMEPRIIEKIVVVWLGGHALHWPNTREFNLRQDLYASRRIFDCGVPLVHVPCGGVADRLLTTIPELERHLHGKSEIGTYLTDIVRSYAEDPYAWSKVIWDIATIAWLVAPEWLSSSLFHSPILTDGLTWSFDAGRHFIRCVTSINRDAVFADVFRKLSR